MEIIKTIAEMQARAFELRAAGEKLAFVPTMGALHEGHLSLVDIAKEHGTKVVSSIFVNPAQFGPNEDLDKYPRTLDADLGALRERGVDIVFCPGIDEMYPQNYSTYVNEEKLSSGMCGVSRPVFFRGVCTVVTRLFNMTQPHVAIFGQKDAQQAAVIKKMVRDLAIPVEVVIGETVREPDGLAMSSRNQYLSRQQRIDATLIYKALCKAQEMVADGMRNTDRISAEVVHIITQSRRMRVIYVSLVNPDTMEPVREITPGKTLLALATWCDEVRLIDNVLL